MTDGMLTTFDPDEPRTAVRVTDPALVPGYHTMNHDPPPPSPCWLPIVALQSQRHGNVETHFSPALTLMYLRGIFGTDIGDGNEITNEVEAMSRYKHLIGLRANRHRWGGPKEWSLIPEHWLSSICDALADANANGIPLEFANTTILNMAYFDRWSGSMAQGSKPLAGWGGRALPPAIRVVMVAPVLASGIETGYGREQVRLHHYNPLTVTEEAVCRKTAGLDGYALDPEYQMQGTLDLKDTFPIPHELGVEAILHDCGLRSSSDPSSKVGFLSKRLNTLLFPLKPMAEKFGDSYVEFITTELGVTAEQFFGSVLDKEDPRYFPSQAAARRAMTIRSVLGEDVGGIPDHSSSDTPAENPERSTMFVETWMDTRGCKTVDVCGSKPRFYHEFIRCTVCNGEVEVVAPREHIPPETECPHCLTAGSISWAYRLSGDPPMTGSESSETNTQ